MGTDWVCLGCGFIFKDGELPKKCPVCGAPKRAFYVRYETAGLPPLKMPHEIKVKPVPQEEMKQWVCLGCGHIDEADSPPDMCPVCGAPRRAFMPRQYYG